MVMARVMTAMVMVVTEVENIDIGVKEQAPLPGAGWLIV